MFIVVLTHVQIWFEIPPDSRLRRVHHGLQTQLSEGSAGQDPLVRWLCTMFGNILLATLKGHRRCPAALWIPAAEHLKVPLRWCHQNSKRQEGFFLVFFQALDEVFDIDSMSIISHVCGRRVDEVMLARHTGKSERAAPLPALQSHLAG